MANELREYLDSLGLRDEAIEKAVELAVPDTFRKDLAELGGQVSKYEAELKDLRPLKEAPKRDEAYGRVGIKGQLPKYARDWLDSNVPVDKLDDLDFVAAKVQEGGFEVDLSNVQNPGEKTGAEQIVDFTSTAGTGAPVRTGQQAKDQAFYADLDSVPDGDKTAIKAVMEKHGRLPVDS